MVSFIDYRTKTNKGDEIWLPVKAGSQVERGLGCWKFYTGRNSRANNAKEVSVFAAQWTIIPK